MIGLIFDKAMARCRVIASSAEEVFVRTGDLPSALVMRMEILARTRKRTACSTDR